MRFKAAIKICLIAIWIVVQPIFLMIAHVITPKKVAWYRKYFWNIAGNILGFRYKVIGRPIAHRPLMVALNHTSLIDIIVLGKKFNPNFIAKSDVGKWPVFGFAARLGGTLFISRKPQDAKKEEARLATVLKKQRRPVFFFPEGTTNNGTHILPFKPALFEIALKNNVFVQPAVIKYTKINGKPTTMTSRRLVSWTIKDKSNMLQKIFQVLTFKSWEVTIKFLDPVSPHLFADRKAFAKHIEEIIRKEYNSL